MIIESIGQLKEIGTKRREREKDNSLSKNKSIITMSLNPQRKRLQPLQQQKARKRIERRAHIPQHFHSRFHSIGSCSKRIDEAEAMIAFRRLSEIWEFA